MKKFIFIILFVFAFCIKSNAQNNFDKYNLSIGYSYSYPNTHEIWTNLIVLEVSYYFNAVDKTYLEDTIAPYGPCRWVDREKSGFKGVKVGYLISKYFSAGILVSWKDYDFDYYNGHCSIHHENHEWITGHCWEIVDKGMGVYAKASYPIGTISLFVCGQVSTNNNNLIGIGIMFNFRDIFK